MSEVITEFETFRKSGFKESQSRERLIELLGIALQRRIGHKATAYRMHLSDSGIDLSYHINSSDVLSISYECHLSLYYRDLSRVDCILITFSGGNRIYPINYKRGAVFEIVFNSGTLHSISEKWISDSYGEWQDVVTQNMDGYERFKETIDVTVS